MNSRLGGSVVVGVLLVTAIAFDVWPGSEKEHDKRPRIPSPSGWCEAYVAEYDGGHSQVMLEFDGAMVGGKCGAGAVTAWAKNRGLHLWWLNPTTIEVQHAKGVRMERNASGEVIQCGGPHRRVRVVLTPM